MQILIYYGSVSNKEKQQDPIARAKAAARRARAAKKKASNNQRNAQQNGARDQTARVKESASA
jgi:hypothetical protein